MDNGTVGIKGSSALDNLLNQTHVDSTILVTGANGFIGNHFVTSFLKRNDLSNFKLVCLTRSHISDTVNHNVTWVKADLSESADIKATLEKYKPDILVHFAWYTEHGSFWGSIKNLDWVTYTNKLISAFASNGGRRAVIAGTCAEYDWTYGWCTEDVTPLRPATLYGRAKFATSILTNSVCDIAACEFVWGRIFSPFGPGESEKKLLPSVLSALISEEEVKCTHGQQYRDFLSIEDVANAFIHLAVVTADTGYFNVCSGIPKKICDVVEYCRNQIDPAAQISFGAIETPHGDPMFLVGDNSKLRATGWSPNKPLESSLDELISRYR